MDNRRFLIIIFLLICLCSFSGCGSKNVTLNKTDSLKADSLIKVRKVNDRAIIVNFGYDAVTAIKTACGIVIIDAGISTTLTWKYRKIIEDVFQQDEFLYVINTHGHHDHTAGNDIFEQAKLVGHENCRNEISERSANREKSMINLAGIADDYDRQLNQHKTNTSEWNDIFTQKIRYWSAFLDVKNRVPARLPDITFSDSLKIEPGDISIEMMHFGRFHSGSDILIYVPEIRVLFTGDLFSEYGRLSRDNSLTADEAVWLRALKWLNRRAGNIETVIDGHGQILSIDDVKSFTDKVLEMCKEGEIINDGG